jgi:hypothetical protein
MRSTLPVAAAFLAGFALTATGDAPAQGFYVNPFATWIVGDSTVQMNDRAKTLLVDQGFDVGGGGARAGWGTVRPGGLYLGAEVEAWGAAGRSRACVNGECFSFSVDASVGGFARVGWQTPGRALGYARFGGQALFTSQGTQFAPAVGIGAEIPIAPQWRVRLDVTYAWTTQDRREFTEVSLGAVREFSW